LGEQEKSVKTIDAKKKTLTMMVFKFRAKVNLEGKSIARFSVGRLVGIKKAIPMILPSQRNMLLCLDVDAVRGAIVSSALAVFLHGSAGANGCHQKDHRAENNECSFHKYILKV
jgi:hypothetical protein